MKQPAPVTALVLSYRESRSVFQLFPTDPSFSRWSSCGYQTSCSK